MLEPLTLDDPSWDPSPDPEPDPDDRPDDRLMRVQPASFDLTTGHGMYSYLCAKLRGMPTPSGPNVHTSQHEYVLTASGQSPKHFTDASHLIVINAQYAILRRMDAVGWADPMADHMAEVEEALDVGLRIKSRPVARLVVGYMRDPVAELVIMRDAVTLLHLRIVEFPWVDFPPAPCPIDGADMVIFGTGGLRYELKMTHISMPTHPNYPDVYYRDYNIVGQCPDPAGNLTEHDLWCIRGMYFRAELDVGPETHFGMCRHVYPMRTIELELARDEDSGAHMYCARIYADGIGLASRHASFSKVVDFIHGDHSGLADWIDGVLLMYRPAHEFARQVRQQARRALDGP